MSLQGTLETIPLPDVLALLAATKKSGELRITGERGEGRLWLDAGQVVGADVPRAATLSDAVFELLRLSAGSFSFGDGSPDAAATPVAVDTLLAEARERLVAWLEIEAVVPSMACTLGLAPELAADKVTVSSAQWKELVAVVAGPDVNGAMTRLGVGEYDACRIVRELADAGLVAVGKAPAAPVAAPEAPRPPVADPEGPATRGELPPPRRATATTPAHRQASGAPPAGAERPTPPPARRLAPGPVPARTADAAPAAPPAVPAPGRVPVAEGSAAPAAAANGGRSAAPARRPAGEPAMDEKEELVRQLATLGSAPVDAAPTGAGAAPAGGTAEADEETPMPAPADDPVAQGAGGDGDEPINRGMLLKFLSSVRS